MPLGNYLLTPTKLYYRPISEIMKNKVGLHGIAHITGGGFYGNINRIIPDNMDAFIKKGSWEIPEVFNFLKELGNIDEKEMFGVFNMGIGMVVVISPQQFEKVRSIGGEMGDKIYNIGTVIKGNGNVIIEKG